jgi:exosortase/archaeosortase family protein
MIATLAGLPHRIDGFAFFVGAHRYIVIDECAGLAYVTLATFLGYSFGLLLYRTFAKVLALALVGAALGIASNVLRVCAIVLIDWSRGSQMDLAAHGTWQWLGLLGGLGMLFYLLVRLVADPAPHAAVAMSGGRATPARALAPMVAGLAAIVVTAGAAALQATLRRSRSARPCRYLRFPVGGMRERRPPGQSHGRSIAVHPHNVRARWARRGGADSRDSRAAGEVAGVAARSRQGRPMARAPHGARARLQRRCVFRIPPFDLAA